MGEDMSNYPDDIRMYDKDPRSPFYDGPEEEDFCERCDELLDECECEYLGEET